MKIAKGEDIAHLGELDQKLWTVLSCPVKGLEFDERTLELMDTDGDGKIRVSEVVAASQWLTWVLKNTDDLLKGEDRIEFSALNEDTEDGRAVLESAKRVLEKLGKSADAEHNPFAQGGITLAEVLEYKGKFEEQCKAAQEAAATAADSEYVAPYGENMEAAVETVNKLRGKVADYFMRCKLVGFDEGSLAAMDVNAEKMAEIGAKDLSACGSEIEAMPLSRPTKEGVLTVGRGINPAWQEEWYKLKAMVLDVDFAGKESITEGEWKQVLAKVDDYVGRKDTQSTTAVEVYDKELADEAAAIVPIEKFLYLYRDFYHLLRNYVVFSDFYSRSDDYLAVFQAGKLFIDQRCCELCVKVTDMAKHADMAGLSGMYLIYCTCTSKVKKETMDIVAVLTDGDVDNLRVGKNAIFYDRNGLDWDATVTKIIDNPISIRQAFWSPYKKFWKWCTEKINKSATERESKSMANLTEKADSATTDMKTKMTADALDPMASREDKKKMKQVFDIAKFAGIFAAIGLAIGAISSALVGFLNAATAHWYSPFLFTAGILLIISGPSMFIAWSKLRKRNLGPVLNANGWAVNAQVLVNVKFGATLTSMAKYPKLVFDDPFADKGTPKWKKWLWSIFVVLVIAFGVLYFSNSLKGIGLMFEPTKISEKLKEDAAADSIKDAQADSIAQAEADSIKAAAEAAPAAE